MFGEESKLFGKASKINRSNSQYPGQEPGDIPNWKEKCEYNIGQEAMDPLTGLYYRCLIDHNSTEVFANDLANGYWTQIIGGSGGPVCDITMEPKLPTFGPSITFTQPEWIQAIDPIVPGVIELTRQQFGGSIYNAAIEVGFTWGVSPVNTEWNSVYTDPVNNGHGDLTNLATRTYGTFQQALNNAIGLYILGTPLVMHDLVNDTYHLFTFHSWSVGARSGGGMSYTRKEVLAVERLCELTFSDGTKLNSARGLVEGPNVTEVVDVDGFVKYIVGSSDILYSDIAFVDPTHGSDPGAAPGVFNKPYQSVSVAISGLVPSSSSANPGLVVLRKGSYSNVTMQPNVHVYCEPGVVITGTLSGNAIGSGQYSKFYGFARFERFFGWSILMDQSSASGGRLDIEFDSIDAAGFLSVNFSPIVKIKCNWARISGYNGGAYGVRMADTADVSFNIREYYHGQHSLFILRRGSAGVAFNGKLTVNCPDLRIIPAYTVSYGNVNNAILQTSEAGAGTVIINGECRIDRPSNSTPAFTFQNQYFAPTIVEINGNVYGRDNHCIWTGYIGWYVDIRVNGDLISNISPINCYTNNTNVDPGPSYITVRNSKLIGYANILGVSRYIKFMNCSFYQYADGVLYPTAPNITWQNDQLGQVKRADFYNCIAEANGASAEFMEFAGTGLTEITLIGCYGNKPVGTGLVPVFSDYVQVPGLKVLNRV